jgi:hypothetical protein
VDRAIVQTLKVRDASSTWICEDVMKRTLAIAVVLLLSSPAICQVDVPPPFSSPPKLVDEPRLPSKPVPTGRVEGLFSSRSSTGSLRECDAFGCYFYNKEHWYRPREPVERK